MCSSRGASPSTFCDFPASVPCGLPATPCFLRCNAPYARSTIAGCCCGKARDSFGGTPHRASFSRPCGRGSRRVRMPSVSPCAPMRSSSRFASCTSAAPARPFSFWVVAERTLRGLSLPVFVVLAAVRSVWASMRHPSSSRLSPLPFASCYVRGPTPSFREFGSACGRIRDGVPCNLPSACRRIPTPCASGYFCVLRRSCGSVRVYVRDVPEPTS